MKPALWVGELLGVGTESGYGVSLLVEVHSWDGKTMHGLVINGAWEFDFTPVTGEATIYAPGGKRPDTGWKVVFRGPVPGKLEGYNDIIQYMEDNLGNHVIALYWSRVRSVIHRHTLRFKTACRAFMQVYRPAKTNTYKQTGHWIEDEEEDSIPF